MIKEGKKTTKKKEIQETEHQKNNIYRFNLGR